MLTLTYPQEMALISIAKHGDKYLGTRRLPMGTLYALDRKKLIGLKWLPMLRPCCGGVKLTTEGEFIVAQLLRGKSFHPRRRAQRRQA